MVVLVVALTESVAVMVSRYVVKLVGLPMEPVTETIPDVVSIEIPDRYGAIDHVLFPVPSVALNAAELSGVPYVVVIADPFEIAIAWLT